jgi:HSP20 family protein
MTQDFTVVPADHKPVGKFAGPTITSPPQPNSRNMKLMNLSPLQSSAWDPFRQLGEIENRLEKYFGRPSLLGDGGERESMTMSQWAPAVDITEDDHEYLVKADLPELKKEDVKVIVENGELTISGERKFEKEEKEKKYHRIERSYGSFVRSFTLPEAISPDKVKAGFKDGLLTIHLPKDEKARPKSIDVKLS